MNNVDYERRYREAAGAVFADLRGRQNWSFREFAERVGGVAHTSLYAIERGDTTPSIDILGRVAACFGMDLTGMMLLIVDQLDPEPSKLTELLDIYRKLSPARRSEISSFISYIEYRDSIR